MATLPLSVDLQLQFIRYPYVSQGLAAAWSLVFLYQFGFSSRTELPAFAA